MFDYGKFHRSALTVIGALILSAVSIGAAVAPASGYAAVPAITASTAIA